MREFRENVEAFTKEKRRKKKKRRTKEEEKEEEMLENFRKERKSIIIPPKSIVKKEFLKRNCNTLKDSFHLNHDSNYSSINKISLCLVFQLKKKIIFKTITLSFSHQNTFKNKEHCFFLLRHTCLNFLLIEKLITLLFYVLYRLICHLIRKYKSIKIGH